ncbi:multicopper oxidase domain-containing protein [Niabella drilacis]|uniref:Copper-resistance protein, CopA family n=1 Tax=Niabella drilacis (strain DSM 25811 / CCM 8410 / CCUG 62505 / LMG 26954 / E90) TaxID=1285928 RepID=A0A1G6L7G7_NIADE|nr:multicopper oxidase domain-containing protein [Niabella drilacis]SDC39292.1 copper-resistance protein, CopA family [Niabella drilacis]
MKQQIKTTGILVLLIVAVLHSQAQRVKRYDLYVTDTMVNYSGKHKMAIAVNGQIPMPTLEFTEGDTAEIVVHNRLKEPTALHWHGVFLPNKEDGVPYLTQMPIGSGTTYTYRFPIIQTGTHWYHSHYGFQEQIGMYGSMIFHKKAGDPTFRKGIDDLPSVPVILSEWTDIMPHNIHRMLRNANDWAAIKKNAVQSYAEAIKAGHFKTKLVNEWKRMLAMDVSDVYYDKMLINGKNESQLSQFKAGDKVRLQLSNGGASTYFWMHYAGGKITVVANDGNDVEPVEVDRFILPPSETIDIVVTIPEQGRSYELLATSEDRTNSTSLFIGEGKKQLAQPLERLKYFEGMKMMNGMMRMNGSMNDMGMEMSLQQMDMNTVMYPEITGPAVSKKEHREQATTSNNREHHSTMEHNHDAMPAGPAMPPAIVTLNYNMLKAPQKTVLPENAPVKELTFTLTGNMNRYVWSLDNKVVSETDKILIKKGEIVRIKLYNASMMRHPMHLHGHDFRVLNDKGDYAPLKNVIDIMPMETDVIEFEANVEGDWFFHCHILYHMMAGMGRIFTYKGQAPNPYITNPQKTIKKLYRDDRMFFLMAENEVASNGNFGSALYHNTRWAFTAEWKLGYTAKRGHEIEASVGRFLGQMQWFRPFVGVEWAYRKDSHEEQDLLGQKFKHDGKPRYTAGFAYTLPWLVLLQTQIDTKGQVRVELGREDIPLSKRLRGAFSLDTRREYMGGLRYIVNRNFSVSANYNTEYGFGGGLVLTY